MKMDSLGKALIAAGLILAAAGLILIFASKLGIPLGRLPGDVVFKQRAVNFYIPITTCIVLSAILSGILWLVGSLRK